MVHSFSISCLQYPLGHWSPFQLEREARWRHTDLLCALPWSDTYTSVHIQSTKTNYIVLGRSIESEKYDSLLCSYFTITILLYGRRIMNFGRKLSVAMYIMYALYSSLSHNILMIPVNRMWTLGLKTIGLGN